MPCGSIRRRGRGRLILFVLKLFLDVVVRLLVERRDDAARDSRHAAVAHARAGLHGSGRALPGYWHRTDRGHIRPGAVHGAAEIPVVFAIRTPSDGSRNLSHIPCTNLTVVSVKKGTITP